MEQTIYDILSTSTTIAVVGMSKETWKPAHTVPGYMINQGYTVIPVNPFADKIFGRTSFPDLNSVPDDIDILNVFRPSDQVLRIVEDAVARHKERGDIRVIWLQLGIINDEAKLLAENAGLVFIQDRCIYIDHRQSGLPRRKKADNDNSPKNENGE